MRGADPRLRNRDGETALQAAVANGRPDCADLVRDFLRRPTFEPEPQSGDSITPPPPPSPSAATIETRGTRTKDKGGGGGGGAGRGGRMVGARDEAKEGVRAAAAAAAAAAGEGGGGGESGGGDGSSRSVGNWGVTGVAPEVCRANAVFCLGRRRRRLGARVRTGRGLGVGVGTAAAEVGLGARRGARLHATNPCSGTAMEAFVLWSIGSGQDPFYSEGGGNEGGEVEDEFEEEQRRHQRDELGRGAAGVWLEHYVRVYNER